MSLLGTFNSVSINGWQNRYGNVVPPWTGDPIIITDSSPVSSGAFGTSVDISGLGQYCVVGAINDTFTILNQGSASVFIKTGSLWVHQTKLFPNDPSTGSKFGSAVSINSTGDTVVVGSSLSRAAYVFVRTGTTWTQQTKLTGSAFGTFGTTTSISADGNTVVVGDPTNPESVYVFVRTGTTWAQQQKIDTPVVFGGTSFGRQVSISANGNRMIVGSRAETITSTITGAAYIYNRSGGVWTLGIKLSGISGMNFGAFVNISGNGSRVVVGSDDVNGSIAGGSTFNGPYVYSGGGTSWSLISTIGKDTSLVNNYETPSLNFAGDILAVSGDRGKMRLYSTPNTAWTLQHSVSYPETNVVPNALDDAGDICVMGNDSYGGFPSTIPPGGGAAFVYSK